MSSEWREMPFGDFVALQRGHDLPDQDRRAGKVPILGSFGITGFHDAVKAKGPGVTIGRSGASFGVASYTDQDYWPLNTALYVTDFKGNDPKFTYYFLKLFDFSAYNSGSAQPSLNRNNLYGIPIRVPVPSIQKQIAALLTAIDDRIALLRETNATLEAIAQALFKSWFVDFDPVHAKQQGRVPEGMDEATAALFPDSFEESELGLVPRGWKVESLTEVFDFKEGPGIRNWQYTNSNEGTRFINIRCIQNGDLTLESANRITDDEANGKYAHFHLKEWDVVVSTSGTLGRSAIVRQEHLPLMLNTSVIRFRPVSGKMAFSYLYEYLNAPEFLFKLESMASGSVQKNFGPIHLKQIKLICPPFELVLHYEKITKPLFEKLIENRAQAQTLVTVRDTLLPRLISGQLRLPEAKAELELEEATL